MCRRDKFFANNYNNNILLLIHVYFIPASRYTLNVLFIVLLLRVPCRSYYVSALSVSFCLIKREITRKCQCSTQQR